MVFAFFGINKFLGIQEVAQIEMFKSDLQDDINNMWGSTQGSQEVKYDLPRKVKGVCFVDDEEKNLFFVPDEFNGGNLEHIDFGKTLGNNLENKDYFCIEYPLHYQYRFFLDMALLFSLFRI